MNIHPHTSVQVLAKKITLLAVSLMITTFCFAQNTLKSPNEFLPTDFGKHFTPHHLLVDYYEYVAANSDRVTLQQYGWTNQKRPLMVAVISSPENIKNIDAIRKNNLVKTGMIGTEEKSTSVKDKSVIWISYGVHGNEAGASESSISTLFELANPTNKESAAWLENTVVIIDPCINPDGYSRYTHWNWNVGTKVPNPEHEAIEHDEPWPGGRTNHYMFDLNRDWAWQTQIESQQRMKVYHTWMPHVHVDVHEQYPENPYYFAPAAQPYHQHITKWQSDFQTEIGKNHVKHFDKESWLYFTREIFDLFYPSYGDTYPTFNGAIGMTYEQAGHSLAGRAILLETGDTLTLADRIAHHTMTSLSTVEMGSKNVDRIVENFEKYFKISSENPDGDYRSFVIRGSNPQGKLSELCKLLDRNKVRYGLAGKKSKGLNAYDYKTGKETNIDINADDIVINIWQPQSVLTKVLFEPEPFLIDSLTYDITAWSMPHAYGLDAFALKQKVSASSEYKTENLADLDISKQAYAFIAPWESMDNARFLSAILKKGINVRTSHEPFSIGGRDYKSGTLVINRGDNRIYTGKLDEDIKAAAKASNQEVIPSTTGYVDYGHDFGADALKLVKAPKILVLSGEETSSNSTGQVWHYFEDALNYPITLMPAGKLSMRKLNEYNLLILPEGYYKGFSDSMLKELRTWVSRGGRVIGIGNAISVFDGKEGFNLERYASESEKDAAKKQPKISDRLVPFAGQERRAISQQMPGAIFRLKMDNTHPLGFGFSDYYFSLKTSGRNYQFLKNTWNVGYIDDDVFYLGFAGSKVVKRMKGTTVFGVEKIGSGSVVYMVDNPLFRGFWEQGKFLFSNAVFFQ